ncbi:arginase family protein [Agromyces laixinhei]|uniref:arginase family protein n=1 Tax=Agromyces laixinhei TaxID=2585717 RepID=UPI001115EFE5|nr:arginase family protein [Agromyces laixinhei]
MAIDLIAAPSNLGLRPPEPGSVPGTAKAPEALRESGLFGAFARLGARDAGTELAARYRAAVEPGATVRNETAIIDHSRRLAGRIDAAIGAGRTPFVIGGDCSIVLAPALALRRRGRFGLVYLDGHGDFRHPGNSDEVGALGGEALAAAVGLHAPAVSDLDGLRPLIQPRDAVQLGARDDEVDAIELAETLGAFLPTSAVRTDGIERTVERVRAVVAASDLDGYWIHLDVDALDPEYMPAVDSVDAGGLDPAELVALLQALAPDAIGADVAIFDPDLDPTGEYAESLTALLEAGFAELGTATVVSTRGQERHG